MHGDTIFPTVQQFADPIMTRTSYNDDVQLVRTAGRWNCALGDSLPLIVARHVLKCDRTTPTIAAATATAVTTTTPTYVLLGLEDTKPFNLAAQKLSLQLTEPPLEPPQPHGPQPLRRGF